MRRALRWQGQSSNERWYISSSGASSVCTAQQCMALTSCVFGLQALVTDLQDCLQGSAAKCCHVLIGSPVVRLSRQVEGREQ